MWKKIRFVVLIILVFFIGLSFGPLIQAFEKLPLLIKNEQVFSDIDSRYLSKQNNEDSVGLYLNPGKVDFGNVEKGETVQKTIEIGNNGKQDANFEIGISDHLPIKVLSNDFSIPAGKKTTVTLEFNSSLFSKEQNINDIVNIAIKAEEGKGASLKFPATVEASVENAPVAKQLMNYYKSNTLMILGLGLLLILVVISVYRLGSKYRNKCTQDVSIQN